MIGIDPDLTFVIDIDPEILLDAVRPAAARTGSEGMGLDFSAALATASGAGG